MKGFLTGIVFTLVALVCGVFAVASFGWYPIGADNPPGGLERAIASRAMNVYADKHKPAMDNPTPLTAGNLTEGAKEYEEHCAFCHGGAKAKISPMQNKFSPPAPQLIAKIPHDPDNWLFWVTKHGVRLTDTLPPETAAAWQQLASEPGEIEEHTPEQHEHKDGKTHVHK
jgi:thiosulfate dehydrogenase